MDKAEAMHHQACLARSWWEFCVEYAVHIYNRTPSKRLGNKTPYEMLNGNKPGISHLRIMGCGAYVFLHEDQWKDALAPHAEYITFIGITNGIKGWKFMRSMNLVFHATKAVFDENTYPHCPEGTHANIPAIETGVLPLDKSNIPPEDVDGPPAPPPVEKDANWHPQDPFSYWPNGGGNGNDY